MRAQHFDSRHTQNRRGMLGIGLILAGLAIFPTAARAAALERTNVVLIYADDMGWGELGCFGHPKFKTPNLDRLAADGAKLTHFTSCCPYCAPSRSGLQTGRYPFRAGILKNPAPDGGVNDVGLPDDEVTLGEAFQSAGYRTICIGKWHMGHRPELFPLRHGYDEYLGILYSNDMRPVQLMSNNDVAEYPLVQATLTRRYTDRAVQFIHDNRERPFFLFLPHAMPHKPLAPSEEFYKKSGAGLYGDVIAELDHEIGRLLAALDETGLAERTLVIFTSDNGASYGGSTGGLRGMKGEPTEGGLRVPFIARWPGHIPAGHESSEPASIVDLYPTVLAAAGIPLPKVDVLDGLDILPLLTSNAKSPHDAIYSIRGESIASVRSGDWKLIVGPLRSRPLLQPGDKWIDPRGPDGVTILAPYEQAHPSEHPGITTGDTWEDYALFNLKDDPTEQHNVAAANPEIVGDLRARFDRMQGELKQAMTDRNRERSN